VQESGRAGRDGEVSDSVVFASQADIEWSSRLAKGGEKPRLGAMVEYCTTARCRRRALLAYFGEARGSCGASDAGSLDVLCDVCADAAAVRQDLARAERVREEVRG
jgi:ATP-dependent DNA helicase RecQ